jgi:hypothetical protein
VTAKALRVSFKVMNCSLNVVMVMQLNILRHTEFYIFSGWAV